MGTDEEALSTPTRTLVDARPAALMNGQSVAWGDLRPTLSEAAGALALRELMLDRRLTAAAKRADIIITDDDMAEEQQRLIAALHRDPNTALRLLDELRARDGLGPVRYEALLRRNAILRRLIAPRVDVSSADVEMLFEARYGPKRQARLIVVNTLIDAQRALNRIRSGESFADVATAMSTDSSAARGGLLEPFASHDPTYPASLRQSVWSLPAPGAISEPILLESGYAIVEFVRAVDAESTTMEEAREELEARVRQSQERIRMDEYAQRVLNDAQLTIFDPSLRDSWQRSRARRSR